MLYNCSNNLHTYSFIRSDRVYIRGGGIDIMIHNDFHIISSHCLVFSYCDVLYITLNSSNVFFFKLLFYMIHLIMILHLFLMSYLILYNIFG